MIRSPKAGGEGWMLVYPEKNEGKYPLFLNVLPNNYCIQFLVNTNITRQ